MALERDAAAEAVYAAHASESHENCMTSPIEPKVIYEQLCNDFRSLNGFLWQTPLIIMTLTGGLWFAVASFDMSEMARSRLLLFATLANIIMIIALFRLRYVMQRIQNQIRAHDQRDVIGPNYTIVACFTLLLLLTALGSFAASRAPAAYFTKGASDAHRG